MTKTELFLSILDDLKIKSNSNDPYQILKSTEIIRSLLFDTSGPLVDKINKDFKLKITYRYVKYGDNLNHPLFKDLMTYISGDGFYPDEFSNSEKIIETKKSEFFNALVIFHDKNLFNVKDILDFALYKLGGTHHENPKSEKDKKISTLNTLYLGNQNSIIFQCRSIGKVVYDALIDLKTEVEKKYYS